MMLLPAPVPTLYLPAPRRWVVSVGGGLSSTVELPLRMIAEHGRDRVDLVMCRLPNEDPDVWRLVEAVENLTGIRVKMIGLNLSPWDVFLQTRYIGNTRIDPCSRILKREQMAQHMKANYDPRFTTLGVGITYHEIDRMAAVRKNWTAQGWKVEAPLATDVMLTRENMMGHCRALFDFVPRLYLMNFSHNNCGGGCVKAGKAQWARLLWYLPDVYEWWERQERIFIVRVGYHTILRDEKSKGGIRSSEPVSLQEFRERMQSKWANMLPGVDPFEGLEETPACVFCEAA